MAATLLALRFILELCLLASVVVIGLGVADSIVAGLLAAAMLVAVVGGLWGALLAPRRRIDLPLAVRVVIELGLFLAVAVGLATSGYDVAGAVLFAAEVLLLSVLGALGYPPGSVPRESRAP
jgi:hypothetical protein